MFFLTLTFRRQLRIQMSGVNDSHFNVEWNNLPPIQLIHSNVESVLPPEMFIGNLCVGLTSLYKHCTALHCTALHCTAQYCTAYPCINTLQYSILNESNFVLNKQHYDRHSLHTREIQIQIQIHGSHKSPQETGQIRPNSQ